MEDVIRRYKAIFDPYVKSKYDDWLDVVPYITIVTIPKRTVIKESGEPDLHLRFVLEGAGAILIKENGKLLCTDICMEDEFLTDFDSLNTGKPSKNYIYTFERTKLALMDRDWLFYRFKESSVGAEMALALINMQNRRVQKNHIEHLGKTISARYFALQKKNRKLVRRAPQNILAAYLGTTPEVLSRIRKTPPSRDP